MQGAERCGYQKAGCLFTWGGLLAYLQKQDAQERCVGPWQPKLPLPHG